MRSFPEEETETMFHLVLLRNLGPVNIVGEPRLQMFLFLPGRGRQEGARYSTTRHPRGPRPSLEGPGRGPLEPRN